MTTLVLAPAALAASTISGFLGMGGGISLLGVMTVVLPAGQVVPIHGVVQLASNFTRVFVYLRHVAWRIFFVYAVPMAAGIALGALAWQGEKLGWFRPAIGLYILAFLYWRRHKPKLRSVPLAWYAPLGFAAGLLSLFVGATGPFIAPFFLRDDFDKEQVIATKAVCQAWGHFLKLPAFLALGFDYRPHGMLLAVLLLCVVAGTMLGKRLLPFITKERWVFWFEVVLGLLGGGLMLGPLLR